MMIEEIVYNYLKDKLSAPVFVFKQEQMPDRFVYLEKTSGAEKEHLPNATIAFQSYGLSLFDAASLNEEVKKVVKNMIELSEISAVKLNADYNYTDIQSKKYRYQAVFDIYY